MIDVKQQNQLFELIANTLDRDIECWAFGGTAMMYYGYKTSTKDIDLLFVGKQQRDAFVRALISLQYRQASPKGVYPEKKKGIPLMFERSQERIDIFLQKILNNNIPESMRKEFFAKLDFVKKHTLTVYVMKKEDIVLLKAVTERDRDFDDIFLIANKDTLNWDYIVNRAWEVSSVGDGWMIYDLEEKMRKLKKHIRIEKKYFDKVYTFKPRQKK